ncbi:MAG TPA: DUF4468 domain-containing protein [Cyclobacteriaceae bacterium]|nr:DUF4468 domain-containing protein [Cyclobacteriaceae bacterium]
MKTFFLIVVLGLSLKTNCEGQSATVGVMDFSNVVVADSLSKELLFRNALSWVNTLNDKTVLSQKDSIQGKVEGESSYLVYTQQAGILKKLSGRVSYKIFIEVKDNKYRYHFSNFMFHYYKQDRNYNMVETGKVKSMNEQSATGWQKLWDSHRVTTQNKMKEYGKQLEIKMIEKPETPSEKVIAKKVEW